MKLQITKFKTKDFYLECPKHGKVHVKSAYDKHLKAMTGISCEKCPDILAPVLK